MMTKLTLQWENYNGLLIPKHIKAGKLLTLALYGTDHPAKFRMIHERE